MPKLVDAPPSGPLTCKLFLISMAIPYMIGVWFSLNHLDWVMTKAPFLQVILQPSEPEKIPTSRALKDLDECYNKLTNTMFRALRAERRDRPFDGVSIVMHRNGEPDPCGEASSTTTTEGGEIDLMEAFKQTLREMNECPTDFQNKYQVESLLTRYFHRLLASSSSCTGVEDDSIPEDGLYGYCDMGEAKTPILLDHNELVPVRSLQQNNNNKTFLPCHFHSEYGVRITSLSQFAQMARRAAHPEECQADGCTEQRRQLHLYAVPAGRVFMFAPKYVGQIIPLPHVRGGDPSKPVYLEVLSTSPRIFDVVNFFSKEESRELVDRALQEKSDSHRIQRSTTGATGHYVNNRRTSESGYDTSGATAMRIKRRCFDALGYDEYIESHADGLQILRYNKSTAYIPHMDWIDGNDQLEHDYESGGKGGNRYATILLYMTDLGENDGGETVFAEAWPVGQAETDHVDTNTALEALRNSEQGSILERGSWQEELVAKCRTKLAIRPNSARAVLFYSQLPNGQPDMMSLHGACPVLSDTPKWAANLWVWNTPRNTYPGHPINPNYKGNNEVKEEKPVAKFTNSGEDASLQNAELYYTDTFWAKLGANDEPVRVYTYEGHVWNLKVDGKTVKTWTIGSGMEHEFTI